MQRLPAELRQAVFQQCDHPTLASFRLVNHCFNEDVTPLVFEHFWMSISVQDLHRLDGVANSKLVRHIKRFTFYAREIPTRKIDDLNYAWQSAGWQAFDGLDSFSLPEPVLQSESRTLEKRWEDQKNWFSSDHERMFKELFARLPGLKEVQLKLSFSPVQRSKFNLFERLVEERDWFPGSHQYNELQPLAYAAVFLLEAIGFRESFAGTAPLESVTIPTMAQNGFIMDPSRTYELGLAKPFVPRQPKALMVDAFTRLCKLDLRFTEVHFVSVTAYVDRFLEEITHMARSMAGFLHAAVRLHTLYLRFDDRSAVHTCPVLAGMIAAQINSTDAFLPSVEFLTLAGRLDQRDVRTIACSIAAQLRELRLVREIDTRNGELIAKDMSERLPWTEVSLANYAEVMG